MKKMLTRSMVCVALTLSPMALAQDEAAMAAPAAPATPAGETVRQPSPDAVKDTWNYFYKGQGQGPILVEAKLCTEVAKEGANKFECTAEVGAEGVKANTPGVVLWQSYLVPQGDVVEDLMVQVKQGNTVRETKDVKLKGEGWRARNWTGIRLNKAGSWTITILRGDKVLKELQVKVL